MQAKLDDYFAERNFNSFEGERGVRNMEKTIREVCGYRADWGGTLQNFFIDNPGAIEAVMGWIAEQNVPDWNENLNNLTSVEDEEPENDEE